MGVDRVPAEFAFSNGGGGGCGLIPCVAVVLTKKIVVNKLVCLYYNIYIYIKISNNFLTF